MLAMIVMRQVCTPCQLRIERRHTRNQLVELMADRHLTGDRCIAA